MLFLFCSRMDPPKKKAKMDHGYKEDPFVLLPPNDPVWLNIKYVTINKDTNNKQYLL